MSRDWMEWGILGHWHWPQGGQRQQTTSWEDFITKKVSDVLSIVRSFEDVVSLAGTGRGRSNFT